MVVVRYCGVGASFHAVQIETWSSKEVVKGASSEERSRWKIQFLPSHADSFIASSVFFWFIVLPSLVRVGAAVFQCHQIGLPDSAKPSYLKISLEEKCWSERHTSYALGVGFPMLFFYAALVPALIALRLRPKEHRLSNPHMMLLWGFFHSGCSCSIFLVVLCVPTTFLIFFWFSLHIIHTPNRQAN